MSLALAGNKPLIASYFNHVDEVIFNPDYEINLNWQHVFVDRFDRIPKEIREKDDVHNIVQKFLGNESKLKKLAKRNYKMVVPQYYNQKVQFLLPVYLDSRIIGKPDFALVLDFDDILQEYLGTTILTLEMTYQNARLIAQPDSPWLVNEIG